MGEDSAETKRRMHAELLCDAGYFQRMDGVEYRITNQGYDYLAVIRNEGIWKKTKEGAGKVGGVTLAILKDIAIAIVKNELAQKAGIQI